MKKNDYSFDYGEDLFLSSSEVVYNTIPANQSQNNCAACNNSAGR